MSCCNECEKTGGDCGFGLGLLGQQGTVTTGSYVVAGSVIAWGGHIVQPFDGASVGWSAEIEGAIKNALWNHGGFSEVNAGQIGGFFNPYISIRVRTRIDFGRLADVFDTIQGAIWQSGYAPEAKAFVVESVPPSAVNQPGIATPGTGGNVNSGGNPNGDSWGLPSLDWPSIGGNSGGGNPIDALANWLGIGQTEALVVGAVGAIVGIVALKRFL